MEGDLKNKRYQGGGPVSVHGYSKLGRVETHRSHSSPTSLLRKFPHSLRHDQRLQARAKRNSTPAREETVRQDEDPRRPEARERKKGRVTPVDVQALSEPDTQGAEAAAAVPALTPPEQPAVIQPPARKLISPVHKSTPNLLRDEPFGISSSVSHPERISDRLSGRTDRVVVRERSADSVQHVPSAAGDSLGHKYRFIHSLLPRINRTISESHESLNSPRKPSLQKVLRRSESQVTGDGFLSRYHALTGSKCDAESERPLIEAEPSRRPTMPSLKGLVPRMTHPSITLGSCSSLDVSAEREDLAIKKCETVYALSTLVEPMQAVNRLRVPAGGLGGSCSRICSRCSSLLSMASSSRYSINTAGSGFIACQDRDKDKTPEPIMLCKLCLMEIPLSLSMEIGQCGCVFCRDCMLLYVEFEIQEGAYDISCPDAQCQKQGTVTIAEVETLVAPQMLERYRRFRLNREVDLDRNRTWCPRAGCETVCDICAREKCEPTSVHCHTCDSDFCSNCKNPWHEGLTCEENSRKLVKEGRADLMEPGIPFDSDSIKFCPMCSVPIEKDEGCAQMMCKRCKHVFCWYCLASLDDDFLLRHYDKGPCKNKLGHSRASVIWHRTQVIGIFAGFGILLLVASPLLLLAAPCIVCCKCRVCSGNKLDSDDDLTEESGII